MFSSVLTFPRNRGKLLLHSCGSSAPRNVVQIPHNWCHAGLPLQSCTDPKLVSLEMLPVLQDGLVALVFIYAIIREKDYC